MLNKISEFIKKEVEMLEKEAYERGYKDGKESADILEEGDKIRIIDDSNSLGYYMVGDVLTVDKVETWMGSERVYVKELEGIPGGNFSIKKSEYRVIKDGGFAPVRCTRKAVVGDLIKITRPMTTAGKYYKGDVLKVTDVTDREVHVRGLYLDTWIYIPVNICHGEYVVVGKVYS